MNAPVIIIMGPQGSGKGTQVQLLAQRLNLAAYSSGALLRASGDPKILERISQGILALSEDIIRVMGEAIESTPPNQGILIDGFPRMIAEAQWLKAELDGLKRPIKRLIYLAIPREESIKRLLLRAQKEGRTDDTEEAINRRLDWSETEAKASLDYFRSLGLVTEVDGLGTVEEVAERINRVVDEA